MWETLNTTHHERCGSRARAGRGPRRTSFFGWVRDRAADAARARRRDDEPRRRLALPRARPQPRAGRHDHPAAVARATATRAGRTGWTTTLRCCSAYEAYLRTYQPRGRRVVGGRVPAARPALPALGVPRAHHRRRQPRRARPARRARRRRRRGPPPARAGCCAELEFLHVDEAMDDLPELLGTLQHECADVHAAIARRYFRETRVIEWSVLTCRWRLTGPAHAPPTSTRASCTRRTTRRASRRSTPRTSSRSNTGSRCTRRRTCSGTATTGAAGCTLRPPPAAHASSPWSASSLVETAERTPNLDDTVAWDAIDAPGLTDRFCEYLDDDAR